MIERVNNRCSAQALTASVFSPRSTGLRLDKLARQFAATRDMKVKEEIERLAKEHGKLKEPWVFVVK